MPRIKRWFPVSQDLLDDPEVIKLRRECGDRAVFMWLRMLSWSDRNDGELKGDRTSIAMTFGRDHDPIHPRSNVDWGLKCLRLMEDQGWITVESSRVLIRNHAKYHNTRDVNKTPLGIQTTSPPNLSEPIRTLKEKKIYKRKEDEDGFADFYTVYPRKIGRVAALRAWVSLKPDEDLRAVIMGAIETQKRWPSWSRDGGQYVPHPATWLNQRRWEDEGAKEPERTGVWARPLRPMRSGD
jgi:hypothetical protein